MTTPQQIEESENRFIHSIGKKIKDCSYEEINKDFKTKRETVNNLDRYKDKMKIKLMQEDLYAINIILKEMENRTPMS